MFGNRDHAFQKRQLLKVRKEENHEVIEDLRHLYEIYTKS